jgi:hypothetical protein
MAHEQKPDFVFRRNGRVHLNRQGRQFSRLLAAEVCASAVVMLDTPRSEVVWRVLATHSIRQFPLHFPSRASPCAIAFQLDSSMEQESMQGLKASSSARILIIILSRLLRLFSWWISRVRGGWKLHENLKLRTPKRSAFNCVRSTSRKIKFLESLNEIIFRARSSGL